MNSAERKSFPVFWLLFFLVNLSYAFAGSYDDIHVLKISAQDERAVIKTPDGKMQIIKPGDPIGVSGKITEIAADRVVVEEKTGNETEKVIIRLINGKQKVERIKKTVEQAPAMRAPAEQDMNTGKQGSSFH
jgi:hypothetical protein